MMLVPIVPFYLEETGISGTTETHTWAGVAIAAPALAMVVMAAAATPFVLVMGRLLQGSLGGVVEAAAAFAGSAGSERKRGSSLGKSFSATAAGSLAGPIAGGLFVGSGGLRQFMLAIAVVAAALAVACAVGPRAPVSRRASHVPQRETSAGKNSRRNSVTDVPGAVPLAVATPSPTPGSHCALWIVHEEVRPW